MFYVRGSRNPQRMLCEDRNGKVNADAHTCGGWNQGAGIATGFDKYWNDWPDISHMNGIAQKYINSCNPTPKPENTVGLNYQVKLNINGFRGETQCPSGKMIHKKHFLVAAVKINGVNFSLKDGAADFPCGCYVLIFGGKTTAYWRNPKSVEYIWRPIFQLACKV